VDVHSDALIEHGAGPAGRPLNLVQRFDHKGRQPAQSIGAASVQQRFRSRGTILSVQAIPAANHRMQATGSAAARLRQRLMRGVGRAVS
jgi:hypothetical protein